MPRLEADSFWFLPGAVAKLCRVTLGSTLEPFVVCPECYSPQPEGKAKMGFRSGDRNHAKNDTIRTL